MFLEMINKNYGNVCFIDFILNLTQNNVCKRKFEITIIERNIKLMLKNLIKAWLKKKKYVNKNSFVFAFQFHFQE